MDRVTPFIAEFNRESSRRRVSGIRSMNIQDSELSAFAGLLDRVASSELAGSMLCGLSTCLPGAAAVPEAEPAAALQAAEA